MEDGSSFVRRWEDMDIDILVRIFQSFDIFELTSGIAQVCSAWRLAACDPLLWKTLDLSVLKSNFIKIPGNILTLIFHYDLYVRDDQLTYTAERCRQLKRLVMPAWNRIKKTGICMAIQMWEDLESLTMPSISNPPYLMEEIAKNCKNFAELKIMGPCDIIFACALVEYLPNLKVLSLRCSTIWNGCSNHYLGTLEEPRSAKYISLSPSRNPSTACTKKSAQGARRFNS
ncbi:RNI-like superfamily protein [Actinidia rufa]|uniref:RNI-like superfamily protein n=1 Tax=Actinidia rufa TaxID=165716 RepID=A0A7J0GX48_9ERIC|nr:RNI-like superfamily protein [Actinidia rufa]